MSPRARATRRLRPSLTVSVRADGAAARLAARGLGRWLERAATRRTRGTVDIAIVSDRRMREMNLMFRGVDRATDVLSFPSESRDKPSRQRHLGDIAVASGVAAAQARRHGHPLRLELRILALHGFLHLLGYDHERDQGQMRAFEDRLRRRLALPSALIGRADRSVTRR